MSDGAINEEKYHEDELGAIQDDDNDISKVVSNNEDKIPQVEKSLSEKDDNDNVSK